MKIGIIGLGGIAEKMTYTLNCMEDAICYAVASRNIDKARDFANKFNIEKAYGSYEEIVKDNDVELIYVATPHSVHYDCVKLCIENNKPVICEKPFTVNAKQAKEIFDLTKEKGVFVTEAIWTRYMPSAKIMIDIINSGKIGDVNTVSANLGYNIKHIDRLINPNLAGGALLDVGIYTLTFIAMVLGSDVESFTTSCVKTETGVDGQNTVILKYKNGSVGIAHSSILNATEQNGIVYGTKGYLIVHNINNVDKISIYSEDRKLLEEIKIPEQITGFEYEIRSSIKAIKEGKIECDEISHNEILKIMELMDSIRNEWGIKYPFE